METEDYRTAAMNASVLWKQWGTLKGQIQINIKTVKVVQKDEYRFFQDIPRSHLLTREIWKDILTFLPKEVALHTPSLWKRKIWQSA